MKGEGTSEAFLVARNLIVIHKDVGENLLTWILMFTFLHELYFNKKLRNVNSFLESIGKYIWDLGVGKDFLNNKLSHQT